MKSKAVWKKESYVRVEKLQSWFLLLRLECAEEEEKEEEKSGTTTTTTTTTTSVAENSAVRPRKTATGVKKQTRKERKVIPTTHLSTTVITPAPALSSWFSCSDFLPALPTPPPITPSITTKTITSNQTPQKQKQNQPPNFKQSPTLTQQKLNIFTFFYLNQVFFFSYFLYWSFCEFYTKNCKIGPEKHIYPHFPRFSCRKKVKIRSQKKTEIPNENKPK